MDFDLWIPQAAVSAKTQPNEPLSAQLKIH